MAIADPRLNRIVSLKRRAAEAQFRSISQLMNEIERQIEQCELDLNENHPSNANGFSGDFLAAEKFTQKLLHKLKMLSQKRIGLLPELSKARYELQKIIVSEQVLDED